MKKIILLTIVAVFIASMIGCAAKNNEATNEPTNEAVATETEKTVETPKFIIGGIPDQNTSTLDERFTNLALHIAATTGLEVEYLPSTDYSALVTGFERNEVHLGWFGGLTGVQARTRVENSEAIAQRPRDEKFESVFIVNKEFDVTTLEDLKGLSFTFGSESSTSGHLMPRHFMMEAGIDPDTELNGKPNYSGSHDTTWTLVESGAFNAGALNIAVWESAVAENKVDLEKVDVFYTTPHYFDYNWTIGDVDAIYGEGTKAKVKEALLSFGEAYPEAMAAFHDDKFIESNDSNYDAILSVAKALGIIE